MDATVKRGDTVPLPLGIVTANTAFNLTGSTVKAFVRDGAGAKHTLPAEVTGPLEVSVQTETLAVGQYQLEVEVTRSGKTKTVPDNGFQRLLVYEDLG